MSNRLLPQASIELALEIKVARAVRLAGDVRHLRRIECATCVAAPLLDIHQSRREEVRSMLHVQAREQRAMLVDVQTLVVAEPRESLVAALRWRIWR